MTEIIFKEESYKIIEICIQVHLELGIVFKEAVYKDASEGEFKNNSIAFEKERRFTIEYKGIILPHKYFADFIVFSAIILEVKSSPLIVNNFVAQTINYLKASGLKLGIIANFGEKSFTYKRLIF
jgi:GxxExxY protein